MNTEFKKQCFKCSIEKSLSEFYKRKASKDGYNASCKNCMYTKSNRKVKSREERLKEGRKYYKDNCEKLKQDRKNYYNEHSEEIKEKAKIKRRSRTDNEKRKQSEYNKSYYTKNKDKLLKDMKKYQIENKENIKIKQKTYYIENEEKFKQYKKNWYIKNKEDVAIKSKYYYYENLEKKREYSKKYRENNKEKIKESKKEYAIKNKEKVKERNRIYRNRNKEKINQKRRERYKNDLSFKISDILRKRIRDILKGMNKAGSAVRDLGCSIEEFKKYIESKFLPGMTWENHGYDMWHIDHIIPLSKFNLTDREQFLKACHYTNLQPLWAKDNFIKNDKILPEHYDKAKSLGISI